VKRADRSVSQPIRFDLARESVALSRDLAASVIKTSFGPHSAVDGYQIGRARLDKPPPHDGERHPDGDEILYVVAGAVDVLLETEPAQRIALEAGDGLIVPRGVWHRLEIVAPAEILYATPGRSEARPRGGRAARRP
jgi:quercetin dioxygenase-like cupin family protein